MDLVDGLRVFVASVETGSFSGAAAGSACRPSLLPNTWLSSRRNLVRLLHRTTRRLGMTAAGEQFIARAPDWLNELDEMTGDLSEARARSDRHLTCLGAGHLRRTVRTVNALAGFVRAHSGSGDRSAPVRPVRRSGSGGDRHRHPYRTAGQLCADRPQSWVRQHCCSWPRLPILAADRGMPANVDDLAHHVCIRDTNMRGDGAWSLIEKAETPRITVSGLYSCQQCPPCT